jgi:hypothetical protein
MALFNTNDNCYTDSSMQALNPIIKYRYSIFPAIALIEIAIILNFIIINQFQIIISFITASETVPIFLFKQEYMKPVLLIKKKLEISKNGTFPQSDTIQETHLIGILVENRGHSAAENCQGCIITNDGKKPGGRINDQI